MGNITGIGAATRFKSGSKAAEAGRKGGKASGVTKAKQKTMRDAMAAILSGTYITGEGNKLSGTEMMMATLFRIATDDTHKQCISAQRLIREITGEDISPEARKAIDKKLELIDKQIELTEARTDNMGW